MEGSGGLNGYGKRVDCDNAADELSGGRHSRPTVAVRRRELSETERLNTADPQPASPAPVIVWLHTGAFIGSSVRLPRDQRKQACRVDGNDRRRAKLPSRAVRVPDAGALGRNPDGSAGGDARPSG